MPPRKMKPKKTGIIHCGSKSKTATTPPPIGALDDTMAEPLEVPEPEEHVPGWLQVIYSAQDYLNDHMTVNKFVQLVLVSYMCHILAMKNIDYLQENYSILLFGLIGVFAGVVISYKGKYSLFEKGVLKEEPPLPSFDLIYAVVIPLCLSFILDKDSIGLNLALSTSISDIHWIPDLVIPISFLQTYEENGFFPYQVIKVLIHRGLLYLISSLSKSDDNNRSLNKTEIQLLTVLLDNLLFHIDPDTSPIALVILQKLMIVLIGLIVLNIPMMMAYRNSGSKPIHAYAIAATFGAGFYYGVNYLLEPVLDQSPVVWLQEFIFEDESRLLILQAWIVCLAVIVPLTFNFSGKLSLNTRRKIWHYSIFAMLVVPLAQDYEFAQIALGGMISIFVIIELLRSTNLTFIGEWLNNLMIDFQDHRDQSGPLVISYLFLLIGIALPVLFNKECSTSSYAGLIALGVGDSLASTIGKKFGSNKWTGTDKTIEGTIGFVFASAVCFLGLMHVGFITDKSYEAVLITSLLGGIMEGVAELNDNFLIPCFMFIVLEGF